ncbi:cytochrome b5-like heme/steroid binding domain-containing protein [Pavlovales sp. CCMP2436]|nr:cytochrome b5-like heme/steroid binding domain-containing protein [Pavlovales sp. CCMP2436]
MARTAPSRRIDAQELSRHTTRDDAWIAVDGVVYNITPHIDNHPGWKEGSVTTVIAIMAYLGRDATLAWHAVGVHSSRKVQVELSHYRIGILADSVADFADFAPGEQSASAPEARSLHVPARLRYVVTCTAGLALGAAVSAVIFT